MTLTEYVNGLIDHVLATADRLLQLPLFVVLGIGVVLAGLLWLLLRRWHGRPGRVWPRRVVWLLQVALVLGLAAYVVDRRFGELQEQINDLRTRMNTPRELAAAGPAGDATRRQLLFDRDQCERDLQGLYGEVTLRPMVCNQAIDFVQVRLENPLAMVYVAIVDLRDASVQIELGTNLEHKTMTSDFARQQDCVVAINGEAGNSPRPDCGFGPWTGYLMHDGELLMREQAGNPRPFLCFDEHNHAAFRALAAGDRALPANARNVIWGRFDLLVDGEVQLADLRNNQPRTAMAIDRTGDRLFLMVVDGRQPRASWGFTRAEAGMFLKVFGAHDGMLCDEGGSSCMFVDALGGIVNIPSDNIGQERPTYTHFGISRRS